MRNILLYTQIKTSRKLTFLVFISALSTSSDNCLTVLPSTPNMFYNLNFENDYIPDSINFERLENEQKHDSVIKPIYHEVFSNRKPLHSESTKFGKKQKYYEVIGIN